jgi:hypothetical protein
MKYDPELQYYEAIIYKSSDDTYRVAGALP